MKTFRARGGAVAIVLDASPANASVTDTQNVFRALGYRQTVKNAAEGGRLGFHGGMRIRNEALGDLAASFADMPFISGHDWGDVRARGGTILEAAVDTPADGELGLAYTIQAIAPWAIEGLANGTIDRFSFGIALDGAEILCTIHGTPAFSSCYCCPGDAVTVKRGGETLELTAEWEIQSARGIELSAVNVPAVQGTGILNASDQRRVLLSELSVLCGRKHRELVLQPQPQPQPASDPVPPIAAAATLAAELAASLGLPADSTPEQLQAHVAALQASGARVAELERESLAMHVDVALDRLLLEHSIAADVLADLRATASSSGRAAFDAQLALVQRIAPKGMQAPRIRGSLQSDASAAISPGESGDGNDAYEATRHNPHMPALMRTCRVTAEDVRKHGSRQFTVLPNLQELAAATDARGDAMGVPRGPKR